MRLKWKGADYPFLIFLLLLTQGNLLLKPFAFVFYALVFPLSFRFDTRKMGFFYFVMLIYSVFSIATLVAGFNLNYLIVYSIGLFSWLMALVAFMLLESWVKSSTTNTIEKTLTAFFNFNLFVCFIQVIELLIVFGGNPFANQSSGDDMKGIFTNSSVNLVVSSFFVFFFFYHKKYFKAIVAGLLCLSTTYMTGILIMFLVTFYFVFTSDRLKLAHRAGIVSFACLLLIGIVVASPSNVQYARDILGTVVGDNKPRKVVSFIQTFDYIARNPKNFLFGAGMGNFSSRLAFVVDGEYVSWYPREYLYRSKDFRENHFSLWNANLIFDRHERGTSNQPFSVYNQMLGEYGILGLLALVFLYFGFFIRDYKQLTYARVLTFLMVGYLFLDYWFEFYSPTIIFEIMVLLNLKQQDERHTLRA